MVAVHSGFRTRDLSITGSTRLPTALTGPTQFPFTQRRRGLSHCTKRTDRQEDNIITWLLTPQSNVSFGRYFGV
jgi:hypothetical protein